jgi:hypothetical protein
MPLSHSVVTLSSFLSRRRRPVPEGFTIHDQARASLLLIDSTDIYVPTSVTGALWVSSLSPQPSPITRSNASLQQPLSPILLPLLHPLWRRSG